MESLYRVNDGWDVAAETENLVDILGPSPAMKKIVNLIKRVTSSKANVLLTGESGTGKEVVARLIRKLGPRFDKPFIPINCGAISEYLFESELFGHAKGSFTGAYERKKGLIEEAHLGTLFLDEIGDMSLGLQAKILRVIQERQIRAVGDNCFQNIDIRIISATHKNLQDCIQMGKFREDLYYRLGVIPIHIPPLRERPEDISFLIEYFARKYSVKNGLEIRIFTKAAIERLVAHRWEGNVRELENVIERTVVLSPKPIIDVNALPEVEVINADSFIKEATIDLPTVAELEARYVKLILTKTGGKRGKAADILGINRRTLYRKEREDLHSVG